MWPTFVYIQFVSRQDQHFSITGILYILKRLLNQSNLQLFYIVFIIIIHFLNCSLTHTRFIISSII